MTPTDRPSLRDRFLSWYRTNRRTATAVIVTGALALVAVALGLAYALARDVATPVAGDPSAAPTGSGSPTASPDPSAEPPSPSADPSVAPTPVPSLPPVMGYDLLAYPPLPGSWGVVSVNGLNVRETDDASSPIIGVLNVGDLVLATDGGGRIEILADGLAGWVSTGDHEDPWVRAIKTPWTRAQLDGIATDGTAYLAFGTWANLETPPYEGGFEAPLFMYSTDGVTWIESHEGVAGWVTAVDGSEDGWVVISRHSYGGALVTFSEDGRTFGESQGIPGLQHAVAHGPAGWIIVGYDSDLNFFAMRSTDGVSWSDPETISVDHSYARIEASPFGYVVFDPHVNGFMTTIDGVGWSALSTPLGDEDRVVDVELVGQELLAITVADDGTSTIQRGTLESNGVVTWADGAARAFDGYQLDSISAGADGWLALGWDVDALVPSSWTSVDGQTWTRHQIDDAFDGSVGPEPEFGAGGFVGLGNGVDGSSVWRSDDGVAWSLAGAPEPFAVADLQCPSVDDVTTLDLMFLGDRAVECFGNESVTVTGWVPIIEGLGGCCTPTARPQWLAGPYPEGWIVPGEADRMALELYVSPGVDASALYEQHTWVEVTGHYADGAANDCTHTPIPELSHRLTSQEVVRQECASRFVIESVVAAEAP